MKQKAFAKWYTQGRKDCLSVSEFLFFLILLVTFLIKEKSDKRPQTAAAALRLGKEVVGSRGRRKRVMGV
jgi:hypothetical protein